MTAINWGIIGAGNIANSFAKDFQYSSGGKLVSIASRSLEKAIAFKEKYGLKKAYSSYDDLVKDEEIDVVYIATPHNFHFVQASNALKNGKAVLCEKPITVNPIECQKLIEISRLTDNYLMEAMWTFFLPPILKSMEWIKEGRIGQVKYLKADFGFKATFDPTGRLFNPKLAGGALLDIGVYPIALSYYIFNELPSRIHVDAKLYDNDVDLEETMIFEYSNGARANLISTLSYEMPNEAIIIGEKGYIKIPDFFMAKKCFLITGDTVVEQFEDDCKSVGYNYEIDAVNRDLIQGKKQSDIMPMETSLNIQEIIQMVKNKFN